MGRAKARGCYTRFEQRVVNLFEEVLDIDTEKPANVPKPTGGHLLGAAFVFLYLLEADTNPFAHLDLGHPNEFAALSKVAAYFLVDG